MNHAPPTHADLLDIVERAMTKPPAERAAWLEQNSAPAMLQSARRLLELAQNATSDTWTPSTAPAPAADLIGRRIGPFVIDRLVGEGGMGQVFLARRDDGQFDQSVAIKVMRSVGTTAAMRQQFDLERQVLADLRHPNIASLLDGGISDDGLHYVVMEYVEGQTLVEYLAARRPSLETLVALFVKICRAVQAAHQGLVIHRDIKPGNILVDAAGEPRLLDFGIAKVMGAGGRTSDSSETLLGAMTPAYASPEHIRGASLGTASDVYSLGVVLYEALTGERPFDTDGLSPAQTERLLTQTAVPRPSSRAPRREWRRALHGDLDAIVLKALAPETARRYGTAGALADDLERFGRRQPVAAQIDSGWYRLSKLVQRNKVASIATGVTLIAVVGGLAVALWQASVARSQSELAQQQLARAEAVSDFLGDILLSPSMNWDSDIQTGPSATISDILDIAELKLQAELLDQPDVRVELLMRIAEGRQWMDQADRAEATARRAADIVRSDLPANSPTRTESLYRIASALHDMGRSAAAVEQFEAAMQEARRQGTVGDLLWLYLLNDRALAHLDLGETELALSLQTDAVAGLHALIGDDVSPTWCVGYNNLGYLQVVEADLEGAATSYERALAGCESAPEQNALTQATVLNNFADLHAIYDRYGQAIALHERAMATAAPFVERDTGAEEFGIAASGLALRSCESGNLEYGRTGLAAVEARLSDLLDEPEAWVYHQASSACALAAGDAAAAVGHARRAMALGAQRRPTIDATAERELTLARALIVLGATAESRRSARSAVTQYASWLGEQHETTRRVRAELREALAPP